MGHYGSHGSTYATPKTISNHTISKPFHNQNHLISRGSHSTCNCKLNYHDSYTLCKGQYHLLTYSNFIVGQAIREPPFYHSLHFLWCMTHRSLHAITKVYSRQYVMFCYGFAHRPLLHHVYPR
jgi:hypothetical protein